jgi:hypothetical protein
MDVVGTVGASVGWGFTLIFNAFPSLPFLPLGRTTPALLAAAWMVLLFSFLLFLISRSAINRSLTFPTLRLSHLYMV